MMKALITIFLLTALFGSITSSKAQDKMSIEFGTITPQDFEVKPPSTDLHANAIVVADWGNSESIGHTTYDSSIFWNGNKSYYTSTENFLVFSRKTRIKIVNKKGFDAATIFIRLNIGDSSQDELQKLIAYTYNLKNGKVVRTKVKNHSIITRKESKNQVVKKITFPTLQEGSLIEYSYTIQSKKIFNFYPWLFQGKYPCLWSEYNVCIPVFLDFTLSDNNLTFFINKKEPFVLLKANMNYSRYSSRPNITFRTFGEISKLYGDTHKWVMKDVVAVRTDSTKKTFGTIHIKNVTIPTTFSPNGDGVDDKWEIPGLSANYKFAVVKVYQANKELVFESAGYAKAWDGTFNGKPLPVGTYNYSILEDRNENKPAFTGSVTITK